MDQPEPEESEHVAGYLSSQTSSSRHQAVFTVLKSLTWLSERSSRRREEERHEDGVVHDELLQLAEELLPRGVVGSRRPP